jgi:D-beta-D-heptose 7-phosphate kinase/D-beta-D-heptose 1-phosphate adenosyltransferase
MKASDKAREKILSRDELLKEVTRWRLQGKTIVFTNGCFDILHAGHLDILGKAAALGDILVVGLNADESVSRLKGPERPVNQGSFRALMLASLSMTDAVSVFGEDTPYELIAAIVPDIIVKGGDYRPEDVAGADIVVAHGGRVEIIPLVEGYSTTGLIEKIRQL